MDKEKCEFFIKSGNFDALLQLCQKSKENLGDALRASMRIGILESNILGYYACLYLFQLELTNAEKAEIHHIAGMILTSGINYIKGAYRLGYYHAQRCIELVPDNADYRKALYLTFNGIPDSEEGDERTRGRG